MESLTADVIVDNTPLLLFDASEFFLKIRNETINQYLWENVK